MISSVTALMCGVILITVPTIQYGGFFLLRVLSGAYSQLGLTGFQKSMFRAGHAHAGVLVLLALICQPLTDYAGLPIGLEWLTRVGTPLSAILVSGGFFAAAIGKGATQPGKGIRILFVGVIVLAVSVVVLGLGLVINAA